MARDRAQLNLEVEPQLLERLRARAAADGRPLAALVRRWLEAGLSGALEQQAGPAGPDLADLSERVGWLEAELAQLRRSASPERVSAAPRSGEPVEPLRVPVGAGQLEIIGAAHLQAAAASPDGAITTAELAERTGTNRAAWNNWARDKNPGAVRKMPPEVGQWRLVGKAAAEAGGPARWLWEPV